MLLTKRGVRMAAGSTDPEQVEHIRLLLCLERPRSFVGAFDKRAI